jgi:hypothetical protein
MAGFFKLDWKKEFIIVSMILLVTIIMLLFTTYNSCGKNMFECIINFLT